MVKEIYLAHGLKACSPRVRHLEGRNHVVGKLSAGMLLNMWLLDGDRVEWCYRHNGLETGLVPKVTPL